MKAVIPIIFALSLTGCAQIAEHAVDAAIKHCLTFDGFSGARQCKK